MKTEKYYLVTYFSPGTFFAESSSKEFAEIDLKKIATAAKKVKERHGATPWGFEIVEMRRPVEKGEFEVVPKTVRQIGGRYHLTGELKRYDDIPETEKTHILRSNMWGNDWPIIVENRNSWLSTQPFEQEDVIVDWDGKIVRRGDEPELVAYRKKVKKRHEKELAVYR